MNIQQPAESTSSADPKDTQEPLANLLTTQAQRSLTRQEASRNTSLLLATFTEGIAAALVASALQVGRHNLLLTLSCVLLAFGFIAIFFVLFQDRGVSVDIDRVLAEGRVQGLSAPEMSQELLQVDLATVRSGMRAAQSMRDAALVQTGIAAAASTLAILALLLPV